MPNAYTRQQGEGQRPTFTTRRVVDLTVQQTGLGDTSGYVQLPIACRAFRFVCSSGLAAGQVLVALGRPDGRGGVPPALFGFAGVRDAIDPVAIPDLRTEGPGVTDLTFYTSAALAGETVTVYGMTDGRFNTNA